MPLLPEKNKNEHGICETCGATVTDSFCCDNCEDLETLTRPIRQINGLVLIDGIPCGSLLWLFDASRKTYLYYGMLDKFPGVKTQVFDTQSGVLGALWDMSHNNVVELPAPVAYTPE